jgi:hypothetical protein
LKHKNSTLAATIKRTAKIYQDNVFNKTTNILLPLLY